MTVLSRLLPQALVSCAFATTALALPPQTPISNPTPAANEAFGTTSFESGFVVPDINSDTVDDFLLGAPFDQANGGALYLYSGADFSLIRTFVSPNPEPASGIGTGSILASRLVLPNVGGASTPDVIAGAINEASGEGRAYIFDLGDGSVIHTFANPDTANTTGFGDGFALVADQNSDLVDDIVIGGSGNVHVFSGAAPWGLISTIATGSSMGGFVIQHGDLNNDTIPDFSISDPFANSFEGDITFYSGADLSTLITLTDDTPTGNDFFGNVAYTLADYDGDTIPEVGVFSFEPGTSTSQRGELDIYSPGNSWASLGSLTEIGTDFGQKAIDIPDINGDSVRELAVAQSNLTAGTSGRVWIYDGATFSFVKTFQAESPSSDDLYGDIAAAIDFSGDGIEDFVIGAQGTNGTEGAAWYLPFASDAQNASGTINFGFQETPAGPTFPRTATLRNDGFQPLTITGTSFTGDAVFSLVADPSGTVIEPFDQTQIELTFDPSADQVFNGTLEVVTDDTTDGTVSFTLTGTGGTLAPFEDLAQIYACIGPSGGSQIMDIDPATGNRTLIRSEGVPTSGFNPQDVEIYDDNNLIYAGSFQGTRGVFLVDRTTGDVSAPLVTSMVGNDIKGFAHEQGSNVAYSALTDGTIVEWDLAGGNMNFVTLNSGSVGLPLDVEIHPSGDLIIAGVFDLFRVDLGAGTASVIATGGSYPQPYQIEILPNGNVAGVLPTATAAPIIYEIDITTGVATELSGSTVGQGVPYGAINGIGRVGDSILAFGRSSSFFNYGVFQVDQDTGDRQFITLENVIGTGDPFTAYSDGFVVFAGEPVQQAGTADWMSYE